MLQDLITGNVCSMYKRFVDAKGKALEKQEMIDIYNRNDVFWGEYEKKMARHAMALALSGKYKLIEPDWSQSSNPRLAMIGGPFDPEVAEVEEVIEALSVKDIKGTEKTPGEVAVEGAVKDLAKMEKKPKRRVDIDATKPVEKDVEVKLEDMLSEEEKAELEKTASEKVPGEAEIEEGEENLSTDEGRWALAKGMFYKQKMKYSEIAKELEVSEEEVRALFNKYKK